MSFFDTLLESIENGRSVVDALETAYDQGYRDGESSTGFDADTRYDDGYGDGYDDGYERGYNEGSDE